MNELYPDSSDAYVPASCCTESHGVLDQTDCIQFPIRWVSIILPISMLFPSKRSKKSKANYFRYQNHLPGCFDVISDLTDFHSRRTIIAGSFAVVALV